MGRYLEPKVIADICYKAVDDVVRIYGLDRDRIYKLKAQWLCKVHGRCQTCGEEQCSCPSIKTGDNRDTVKVLKQLPHWVRLDKIPCRICGKSTPYDVGAALYRLQKGTDWGAFFKCKKCRVTRKIGFLVGKGKMTEEEGMALLAAKGYAPKKVKKAKTSLKPKAKPKVKEKRLQLQPRAVNAWDKDRPLTQKPFSGLKEALKN